MIYKIKQLAVLWTLAYVFCLCSCCQQIKQTGIVQDLITYPQNVFVYADKLPVDPILSEGEAEELYDKYKKKYFTVWEAKKAKVSAEEAYYIFSETNDITKIQVLENPFSDFSLSGGPLKTWWAENLLNWTDRNWKALTMNADKGAFPSRFDKAILVERVSVRSAPTQSPIFRNPDLAGEGFPFDYFITSNLHMGMPIVVLHTSKDGSWVYIETALVSGWVPEKSVALVTSSIMEQVSNAKQVSITRDTVTLRHNDTFVGLGFLGTVLPLMQEKSSSFIVLAPLRDQYGKAHMVPVEVSKTDASLMPTVLTAKKMASFANPLLNQIYGWGGEFGHRDCSEFIKDLFIPFGVWLPRNSAAQIRAWNFIPIEDKDKTEAKVDMLLKEKGIPFATLIGFKGHIGLYLGMYNNTPVMLHDIWGIRTEKGGVEGRHILGRVVITSLDPGSELSYVESGWLLNKLVGISLLP